MNNTEAYVYIEKNPLLRPAKKGKKRKCKVSSDNKSKSCLNCLEMLPLESFHNKARGVLGKHTLCKPCRGKVAYQRMLEKELESGSNHITNCLRCDSLMKRSMSTKQCRQCNRRD